ncbi:gluconate 2-dehydrogenase subunit 3 family protein [Nitrolancea hollandica]|uniref:Gluconate 2-dehydrogenase subunit 3 family protein n=1 Tax=Nitrolancea hollandica Lb TaxID=1129897 RepID=I4EDA6_9BACT|nr:gluconate 2-dehydrogenase subunit 3 family protein [Nitrolancea hollandica]CCF82668.1 conserved hypothetical protein [Nitrolancea hollandica Lb]
MVRDRYPGWDVLSQRGHWDATTRKVVLDRVHNVPPFQYFESSQILTLGALCARVIPQALRPPDRRVPIAHWIDQYCALGSSGGFRYEDMPPRPVAWTWGLDGLDQSTGALFGSRFAELDDERQDQVLERIRAGDPPGEVWTRMPARRWWISVALRDISGAYYAHPYAWDEIGFGGPAYPRGYAALNHGAPEPWEPREAPDGWHHDRG